MVCSGAWCWSGSGRLFRCGSRSLILVPLLCVSFDSSLFALQFVGSVCYLLVILQLILR